MLGARAVPTTAGESTSVGGYVMSESTVGVEGETPDARYTTLLHIQWAFALSCAYLVLFNEQAEWTVSGALLIVALFSVSLILGRLGSNVLSKPGFIIALAIIDIALVTACLYVADQLSVQIVLLCIGVLVLSIAGLKIGTIALATLLMMGMYLLSVWLGGSESFFRSSVLLRVPLLFTSAFVFAWLVEAGSSSSRRMEQEVSEPLHELEDKLGAQLDSIEQCRNHLREGSSDGIESALEEIAKQNRVIQGRLRALLG